MVSQTSINDTYIRELYHQHGLLDGYLTYLYANAFLKIASTLTASVWQNMTLNRLFNDTVCSNHSGGFFFADMSFPTPQVNVPGGGPLDLFVYVPPGSRSSSSSSKVPVGAQPVAAPSAIVALFAVILMLVTGKF
jgi:hypothetical protein